MKDFRTTFAAFLTGVASGTVLGMLMSTGGGEKQKRKMEKDYEKMADQFRNEIDKKLEQSVSELEDLKRNASKTIDKELRKKSKHK